MFAEDDNALEYHVNFFQAGFEFFYCNIFPLQADVGR